MRRFGLPGEQLRRWIFAALFVIGTVASATVAYATYDYSKQYRGKILPGTSVAGVDLGGMTLDDAKVAVRRAIEPELRQTIVFRYKERTWRVSARQLGARGDVTETVSDAAFASREASFWDKARLRMLGSHGWFDRPLAISYPRRALHGFLEGIAAGFDRPVRDATVDYSTGWVKVVPEQEGRELMRKETYRRLTRALDVGLTEVRLAVDAQKAKVKEDEFDQVLLLRIGENKLYLYEDGKIAHKWTVATGQPEYPTPTGIYEVTEKRYMPTWVNPDPEGWGASMPLSIPPGPGNPLGVRAINWSAEAIRFHGTSATYSLGYNASHGCVRMANEEVIKLYDMIDVGTPIVSTIVAPLKPMYVSAPDPTVVEEDAPTDGSSEADEDNPPREEGRKGGSERKKDR